MKFFKEKENITEVNWKDLEGKCSELSNGYSETWKEYAFYWVTMLGLVLFAENVLAADIVATTKTGLQTLYSLAEIAAPVLVGVGAMGAALLLPGDGREKLIRGGGVGVVSAIVTAAGLSYSKIA